MDDQGEKIVFLAREILNATSAPQRGKKLNVTMSFKTLCLTTLLAAAGGGLVTGWVHEESRPLNRYEKVEIDALVFYATKIKGIDETTLRHDVEKQTGLISLNDLTIADFAKTRRALQEKAL